MKSRLWIMMPLLWLGLFSLDTLAASYKLETVKSFPEDLSADLKELLREQGYKIVTEQGDPWCEIWIRKVAANLNKPPAPGAQYPALHLGELVGVLKFDSTGADYRGQSIKPGLYTMRYCLILQDGNHLGVAPIPDFVLLIPAKDDQKEPDAVMTTNEIVELSRKASGTNHPAVISLAPPSTGNELLEKDDMDHWVLRVKTQSKPGEDLNIGIIVVGRAEG